MIGDVFNSRVQSIMYELLLKLLQNSLSGDEQTEELSGLQRSLQSEDSSGSLQGAKFTDLIAQAAEKYDVNPRLVQAVIKAESNFNPKAVSSAGAEGLMQLMPATAKWLGVSNSLDPAQNIEGGVKFLSSLLDRYGGDTEKALAAYNAGPGTVDKYNGIPPYRETQVYVERVMDYYTNQDWSA